MLEIIPIDEAQKWDAAVQSMHEYDFYHLNACHRLETSGQPYLLHFQTEDAAFCLPVILRKIEGTDYHDITSVYGYAGALSSEKNPSQTAVSAFHSTLQHYCDEQKIVSVFARLHPLFENQAVLLSGLGEVVDLNKTVGIDLTLPENEQRAQYSRALRYQINRLKKKLILKEAQTQAEIDAFVEIYWENMRRVNATEMYFFPFEYFYNFIQTISSAILLAFYEGEIVGGVLFTECHSIIQYHLGATKDQYLYLSPLKYIFDRIRAMGVEKKRHWLHLGGGKGGIDDSLFSFKSLFSKQIFQFKVWKYVHNPAVYEELVQKKYKGNLPQSTFFPLYRA